MGLTASCAVFHDHKFDPLSQREFYEMAAFFNNTTQKPMDGNVKDTPPIVQAPLEADLPRWNELRGLVPASEQEVEAYKQAGRPKFDEWLATAKRADADAWIPSAGVHFEAALNDDAPTISYTVNGEERETPLPNSSEWRDGKTGDKALYLNGGAVLEAADAGDFEGD